VDFFEDEPDSLIKIAIDDINESGLRAFVTGIETKIERSGYFNSSISERELKNMFSRNIQDVINVSYKDNILKLPDIQDFRRMTLCLLY
jgi:hypothetical protein